MIKVKYQYQCIGTFGNFKFLDRKGCGEKWDHDHDMCPICRGYLIPA
jgi:rRNA maturation endonuclease Nob1